LDSISTVLVLEMKNDLAELGIQITKDDPLAAGLVATVRQGEHPERDN
jgi:hypothetical protein